MLNTKMLFNLGDISIIPDVLSKVKSRTECNPFTTDLEKTSDDFYPIVVSPMSSVVDEENYKVFRNNKISTIIPRSVSIEKRLELCKEVFCAFGLKEVREKFLDSEFQHDRFYILIDIANGHLQEQINLGKNLKEKYGNKIQLMGGNIANPKTVTYYALAGFDYLRIGIAGGSRCITGTQTGIYYPMASLIADSKDIVRANKFNLKLIADGGIGAYSDIIKCLALGADYVMSGKIFAQSLEACGSIYQKLDGLKCPIERDSLSLSLGNLYRDYYGMSTKLAQAEIQGFSTISDAKLKGIKLKTSEGKSSEVEIRYTVAGWLDNMDSYLRSTMSYCNAYCLEDFKNNTTCQVITNGASVEINNK